MCIMCQLCEAYRKLYRKQPSPTAKIEVPGCRMLGPPGSSCKWFLKIPKPQKEHITQHNRPHSWHLPAIKGLNDSSCSYFNCSIFGNMTNTDWLAYFTCIVGGHCWTTTIGRVQSMSSLTIPSVCWLALMNLKLRNSIWSTEERCELSKILL